MVKSFQQRRDFASGQHPPARHEEDPRFGGGLLGSWSTGYLLLEAVCEHRNLNASAKAAVQHRSKGLEGRVEAATTTGSAQRAEHTAQHRANGQSATEAAATEESLVSAKSTKATGAAAKLAGEAAEAGEGAKSAAWTTESATGSTEAAGVKALLEACLVRVLLAEAATGLLQASLEACLVRIHAGLDAAILSEALLKACLEGVLSHLSHAGEAATHHLLHLSQLLLHLGQFLLHHALLEAGLVGVLGSALAREPAWLLHREVVELLSVIATAMFLLSKKFAE